MSTTAKKLTVAISPADLEKLIRRVVREVVREELSHLAHVPASSILDDWDQEGLEDPAGDEELLAEALAALEQCKDDPDAWVRWEDLKEELTRAEATGELPD